ncbi:MAG: PLP-dependent cysteine synthase family protein [Rhizomicrobium sp.]
MTSILQRLHQPEPDRPTGAAARRAWTQEAVRLIGADARRTADTNLIRLPFCGAPGIALYLKDESTHPTGSLKHRLARALFLHALCSGWIGPDSTIVEASSGSTAISEAYFAKLLGLRFFAVVPRSVAAAKVAAIRLHGGEVRYVDSAADIHRESLRLARETGGHYMDQFTYAERVGDWRGEDNIARSIFGQMGAEADPVPVWLVCGAGTGGTSATIGRFIRYRQLPTRLCVADPQNSVFHRHYHDRAMTAVPGEEQSCIEGIGRCAIEPSFIPELIDRMLPVSDAQSIGALRAVWEVLGRRCGGSTGTNIWAAAQLISEMKSSGETGSLVTIQCDGGERYADTYFSDAWLQDRGVDWRPERSRMAAFFESGCL